MRKLVLFVIVILCGYWYLHSDDAKPSSDHSSAFSFGSKTDLSTGSSAPHVTHSQQARNWGSGHQAGYDWAEQKGIADSGDCETAGEHSNSLSFAEGCNAYVKEQQ